MYFSAHSMDAFNSDTSDDTLLICTGKSVKLISSFEYFTNNRIVEVSDIGEAPSFDPAPSYFLNSDKNASHQTENIDCPVKLAIEPSFLDLDFLSVNIFTRGSFHLITERIVSLINVSLTYSPRLTRAPPQTS